MDASLTFVGTATTVVRLGPYTVLTDPNFLRRGQRAWLGKGLWTRRRTDPALDVADLPPLHVVVLSHLHGDHWDRVTQRHLDRRVPVVTTPHAADRLRRRGFGTLGLDTWHRAHVDPPPGADPAVSLTVEALPAVHARGAMGRLLPPVMGSLLTYTGPDGGRLRLYLSGDTLTGDHLDEIADRHPDIDVAVVHLGGTRVLARTVTMDGAQGVDLMTRLRPALTVPVHLDDYPVFRSGLGDFLEAARGAGLLAGVRVVRPGTTTDLARDLAPGVPGPVDLRGDPLPHNGSAITTDRRAGSAGGE